MSKISNTVICKQPSENRLVIMGFSNKMADNENIVAIASITASLDNVATSDLVFNDQNYSGSDVQFLISGGVIPTRDDINYCDYKVTVTVTTDMGQTLENDGILRVQEI